MTIIVAEESYPLFQNLTKGEHGRENKKAENHGTFCSHHVQTFTQIRCGRIYISLLSLSLFTWDTTRHTTNITRSITKLGNVHVGVQEVKMQMIHFYIQVPHSLLLGTFYSGTVNRIHDEMLEHTKYSASVFDHPTEILLSN